MNHNLSLECEVCKNIIRLKVYGGYVNNNPFSYSCPNCSVTISGCLIWNEDLDGGLIKEFNCNNARYVSESENESHLLQVATEFYTDKIKKLDVNDPTLFFSPFMMDGIKNYKAKNKMRLVRHITDNFHDDFVVSLRIWELYRNKKFKYLDRQLLAHNFVKPVILGEVLKINYPHIVMQVLYYPFLAFLIESGFDEKIKKFKQLLARIKKGNHEELKKLCESLKDLITYSPGNLVHLLNNFSNYYSYIWPVIISNTYKTENIRELRETKGILTTNFETLKNFYVEAFEVLCSLLPLFLGLQNISIRKNKDFFEEGIKRKFSSIETINDYDKKVINKGNKIKFFEDENIYLDFFDITTILNNTIRNSIGHHSYIYEVDDQLIRFIDRNKETELYLIEFSELLLETFYATFISLEIVSFLQNMDS